MGLLRRIARVRLAGRMLRRLRRAGVPDARYLSRPFEVRFTAPGDTEPTILPLAPFLARQRSLDDLIAELLRVPVSWREAAPMLRPVLRGAAPGAPLSRPALPFLSEFVVVDQPDTMTYVTPAQSATWHSSKDRIFATARANLTGAVLHGSATTVRFVDDGNAYWTSHLLLPGWLGRLSEQVGGVPVAFAPERGTLLVTADDGPHLVALFAEAELLFARSPHRLSPMAYVSDENGCTIPYRSEKLYRTVRRAESLLAIHEYAAQGVTLTLVDGWRTRAVWPKDGPVLLPEADEVLIGDEVVPWADLLPRLTRTDHEPPRWAPRE
ncbi:hypothetical protein [Actinoplanes derwentensis]|uniref:Uncharacterized protein n=1 Tax=Actinoplanes derwentensis TaxID=113562 RepID=A0A1H2CBV4_9ACTN|nr:hypothetical protein [Actinoplanes derwentensis]GID88176.1 hypothetical protein Ade03nite_71000 [Actinoplanes derwentensis]SDT67717.1 hypothetical protein SAMN04489716_5514 [Actinoplanes derwentensis]